jgi:site-specific DNA recombinase
MDRPGLQRVLEMVKGRTIGGLIVAKLDRLTRSTRDVILLIDLLNKKRVTLVSLAESLDTKSPMGRFFVRMIASLAELERETIGSRTRQGMGHLKKLGMPVGTAPYGWRAQRSNKLQPLSFKLPLVWKVPEEQAVLLRVKALRRRGSACVRLARR